eukprot:gene7622-biopygen13603
MPRQGNILRGHFSFKSEGSAPQQAPPPPEPAARFPVAGDSLRRAGSHRACRALGGAGRWMGGWVARCVGGGGRDFPGCIPARKSAPRATRRAARARGGGGWDRRLVQLFNDGLGTPSRSFLASGWRERNPGTWIQKKRIQFRDFRNLSRVGVRDLENPTFTPRSEPPHARAKWSPMIRMVSGSSLAFQRLSRDTLPFILSVRPTLSPDPLPPPTQPQRKNSTTSALALAGCGKTIANDQRLPSGGAGPPGPAPLRKYQDSIFPENKRRAT